MVSRRRCAPRLRLWGCLAFFAAATSQGAPATAACSSLMPQEGLSAPRNVTAQDIIELREIGYPDGAIVGRSPLAASPTGDRIAFILTRADLETNGYCRALMIVRTDGKQRPQVVDAGGDFIPLGTFARGLWVEVGLQSVVTPAWSPDGRSIAVLKRETGVTQAVVFPLAPGGRVTRTHADVDVQDLWWGDSTKLYFSIRPGVAALERKIDREGQSGWLYDRRMAPNYGARPRVEQDKVPLVSYVLDVRDGSTRVATGAAASPVGSGREAVRSTRGREAGLEPLGVSPFAPQQLWVAGKTGGKARCTAPSCIGRFSGLWWAPDGEYIWFLKREGWNNELSVLYRWKGDASQPRPVLSTPDIVQNCIGAAAGLVCTVENSTTPRRIVLIDPATGSRETIFDANPEFANLNLGSVRRLKWRNDRGLPAWGDLVLPPGHRKGTKLPLIVVQYTSRGFLRGGTGNEYPIYPLAARGFAVFSFERPPAVASVIPGLRTDVELNAANEKGWAERKSMLSSLLRGLDLAVASGDVDPDRIGITGLSDGATGARFALLNSARFAAAAISSCCPEPKTSMTYGGIAWAEFNRAIGYPPSTIDDPEFWRPMSVSLNARTFRTPLLIQQSDDEYLLSLEAVEALREWDAPVELYVFPGEHHVKWQPRHKLAVFDRAADWFGFWLKCRVAPDPRKADQYRRWEAMRPRAPAATALCPVSDAATGSAPMPPHPPNA